MRILIFPPCFTNGGAERQARLLAEHLALRGHSVEVWAFPMAEPTQPMQESLRKASIPFQTLARWPCLDWNFSSKPASLSSLFDQHINWPRQLDSFGSTLPRGSFDIVIPFTFWPSLVACLFRSVIGARHAVWNHRGGYDDAGVKYTRFLIRQVQKQNPYFISNSISGASFLSDIFQRPVTSIPNAFVPEFDLPPQKPSLKSRKSVRLVHVANFYPEKDFETLLKGVALAREEGLSLQLHVCGYFPDRAKEIQFRTMLSELNLTECVIPHGATSSQTVYKLIMEADIGLLSSRSEGLPNAVMEYMYASLPIIASNIPGNREVLGEENAKWLFEVGSASGLCMRIKKMANNIELRKAIGESNHNRLTKTYNPSTIFAKWDSFLSNIDGLHGN